ncbi:MAG: FAD-binding oxidoreductase [Pseudomonadota bacterium]
MVREDVLAEDFSPTPLWWRDAPLSDDGAPGDLPDQADAVIIGSGYAGLSCAIELAEAGLDTVVLEANAIGSGASSRAAGFTSGRASISKFVNLEREVGAARASAILEEADEAYEHFKTLLEVRGIDCGFRHTGRFVAARTPRAYDKLAAKMRETQAEDADGLEMIPRAEQGRFVNSDAFHGGMLIKDAGLVHPAKYHAALVALARRAGVRLIAHTRAEAVEDAGTHKRVKTSRGAIQARHVMMGTGGYTDRASPWLRRRVVPMSSTIIATERLGPERVSAALPAGCAFIDTRRVIVFCRPSPDGAHILFGGRAKFLPVGAEESVRILHAQMTEVFPDLADARVINAWSGLMAFTFDFLPKLGEHQGVHHALACNGGAGIVMMSWLGRIAGQKILGTANRSSAFDGLAFRTKPFYTGNPWFVPVMGTWYRFRDWLDLRRA